MALEFDVPYKAKDYDAEFATTRSDKYAPENWNWDAFEMPSLFSGELFGDTLRTSAQSTPPTALPPWFFAAALAVVGGVIWFNMKKGRK